MDPDAALAALREMTSTIEDGHWVDMDEYAATFFALDDWISTKGGFLPAAWRHDKETR